MEFIWAAVLVVLTAWTYTALGAVFLEHPNAANARAAAIVGWMALVVGVALGLVPGTRGMAPGIAAVTVFGIGGYAFLMYLDVPGDPRPRLVRDRTWRLFR